MPIGIVGAMLISAGVGVAGSIYAANQQKKAADKALNVQTTQYGQSREDIEKNLAIARGDLAPYMATGKGALGDIASLYGITGAGVPGGTAVPTPGTPDYSKFFSSPDYQFALDQGILALDRSAAAKGQLTGGGQKKDITAFGQGLASQQFGNYFNRLKSLYDTGLNAATAGANAAVGAGTNLANLSMNFGNSAANSINQAGAASASGAVGVANALSTLPQNLLYSQFLNNSYGGAASPSSYAPINWNSGPAGLPLGGSGNLTMLA